jgi:mannose/cellobiose epimerase-like protein (N-acyl-D-glucosamine 2-epimerase family)
MTGNTQSDEAATARPAISRALRGLAAPAAAAVLLAAGLAAPLALPGPAMAEEGRAARPATAPTGVPQYPLDELLAGIPTGERWVTHLREDLMPFWEMETAIGEPVGDFPTYRCNDGSLPDLAALCPELRFAEPGIVFLEPDWREYLRARSRQVYGYGIAFHLTGERRYLDLAEAGMADILDRFIDPEGGAYSYLVEEDGAWVGAPPSLQRTSQDLAYAGTGMGMLYYLTRDPELLDELLALKDHIWATYFDDPQQFMRWVMEPSPDGDSPNQRELVAQLDQIYAFMLAVTPTLPEPHRSEWEDDLVVLAHTMIEQYFSPRQGMFWGAGTNTGTRRLETPHVDFGHSVKTMWMIHMIGRMSGDLDLVEFGWAHATDILRAAYLPDGSWARRPLLDGGLDTDKEWWILAELDQVSATFSMIDPNYAGYLLTTYDYWLEHMVDHEHGGIWHMVSDATDEPFPCGPGADQCFPKQHSWKNALHSFEHALVGYITGQQFHDLPVSLHYAFVEEPEQGTVHPYFYTGELDAVEEVVDGDRILYRVSFTHVR